MEYTVGDLVWAKVKGYPNWPARVERLPAVRGRNEGKYSVFLYGIHENSYVARSCLKPYQDHKLKFKKPLKREGFAEGIWEIEEDPDLVLTLGKKRASKSYTVPRGKRVKVEKLEGDITSSSQEKGMDITPSSLSVDGDTPNINDDTPTFGGDTPTSFYGPKSTPVNVGKTPLPTLHGNSNKTTPPALGDAKTKRTLSSFDESPQKDSSLSPVIGTPLYKYPLFQEFSTSHCTGPVPPTSNTNPVPPTSSTDPVPPTSSTDPVPPTSSTDPVPPTSSTGPVCPTSSTGPVPPTSSTGPVPPTSSTDPVPPTSSTGPVPPTSSTDPVPPTSSTGPVPTIPPTREGFSFISKICNKQRNLNASQFFKDTEQVVPSEEASFHEIPLFETLSEQSMVDGCGSDSTKMAARSVAPTTQPCTQPSTQDSSQRLDIPETLQKGSGAEVKVVRVRHALKGAELLKTTTFNIKCSLRKKDPNTKQALRYLGDLHDTQFDCAALREFPDIIRTLRMLKKYKTNDRILKKAAQIFLKFKGMYVKYLKEGSPNTAQLPLDKIAIENIDPLPTTPFKYSHSNTPIREPLPSTPSGEPLPATPMEEPLPATPMEDSLSDSPMEEPLPATPSGEPLPATPMEEPHPDPPMEEYLPATSTGEPLPTTPTGEHLLTMSIGEPLLTTPTGEPFPTMPTGELLPTTPGEPLPTIPTRETLPTTPTSYREPLPTTTAGELPTTPIGEPFLTTPTEEPLPHSSEEKDTDKLET